MGQTFFPPILGYSDILQTYYDTTFGSPKRANDRAVKCDNTDLLFFGIDSRKQGYHCQPREQYFNLEPRNIQKMMLCPEIFTFGCLGSCNQEKNFEDSKYFFNSYPFCSLC
jgi:hypothetical protein